MLLGLRHAVRYRLRDALKTPVAPQPFAAGEIGPDRRADGVGAVTPGARRTSHLAVEDPLAEGDLLFRHARRRDE